jgi:hypothetical protein
MFKNMPNLSKKKCTYTHTHTHTLSIVINPRLPWDYYLCAFEESSTFIRAMESSMENTLCMLKSQMIHDYYYYDNISTSH